jgi:hypothetical protein
MREIKFRKKGAYKGLTLNSGYLQIITPTILNSYRKRNITVKLLNHGSVINMANSNREFRFRAWDADNNKWACCDDWWNTIKISCHTVNGLPTVCEQDGEKRFVIEQFTGLTDRLENEIYEGDFVKGANGQVGLVYYDDRCAMFNVKDYYCASADWPGAAFTEGVFEVIGNIHATPELIGR